MYENMIEMIGNTPLVKLKLDEQSSAGVFAKLEMQNPFGMKDRVAKKAIMKAKESGELREGQPIFESSSGTMACGIALVGTALGHPVHIVTDPRLDSITKAKLHSLGCEVHVVEKMGEQGWQGGRLDLLRELLKSYPDGYWLRQYDNPANPEAYTELAHELIDELGQVDVLVAAVGSGGSISGTARELKRYNPACKVIAVDATGSVIFGQPDRPARLQGGIGNSLVAGNVDFSLIDEVHWLNDHEAFAATINLAKNEKIFAGNSSGSVYAVARWISTQLSQDVKIAAIFPDRGDRYAETIYSTDYRHMNGMSSTEFLYRPVEVKKHTVVENWSYAPLL
ncbi:cysteine synthase family protein [Fictibacillus fluitans]|uniref:Cysteine synthase family protein n=1 Tax=Fictibacillus fluitans TaxID=3058422 RepID=A0ABT8HTJ7_9BACL|nr:cysteine synthase family protein [Fictibacillus sp. NE201]MDN4524095.1 cysteine synthase family protein [Fictibacillus sp. NE201]